MSVTNKRDGISCDKAFYKNRDGTMLLMCSVEKDFPCAHAKFCVQEDRYIFKPVAQRCPKNEIGGSGVGGVATKPYSSKKGCGCTANVRQGN